MPTASNLISRSSFHRRVNLTTAHGPLTVSFADIGCATGPAFLYLPGMFASRYLGIPMHVMAERAGVRLLVVDRPGMGASTDVPLARRIAVWTEIVPQLLAHLDIPCVTLVSHSAGTIYLLNTWARCQGLVNPHIILLAPWVDPAHSRVTAMQMAQYLPSRAFALWHHIPRFFVTQARPALASSGAAVRQISMSSGSGSLSQTEGDRSFLDAAWRRVERDYGMPHGEQAELSRLAARFMFAEDTVGANSEALQCLRKGNGGDWGECTDYASFALMISAVERNAGRRVTVRAFFAAKDAMVGRRGQRYLEECWRAPGVEQGIGFVSTTVDGTDHDTVAQSVEVWETIFDLVQQRG
ncbi:alpha/beta-hydrolase [Aspergillus falconensis]